MLDTGRTLSRRATGLDCLWDFLVSQFDDPLLTMSVGMVSQHVCDVDGVPVLTILPPVPLVVVLAYILGRCHRELHGPLWLP